jgi:hypothetical protein
MEPTQTLKRTYDEINAPENATSSDRRVSPRITRTDGYETPRHHFEAFTIQDNARVHAGDVHGGQHTHYHAAPPSFPPTGEISLLDALAFEQMDFRSATIAPAYSRTCDWLFTASAYRRWRHQDLVSEHNGFLWIKGKPGAGKSTIMKHAWEHAQVTYGDEKTVSFFFNARGAALGKSVEGMYRCLLHQMASQVPHLERRVSNVDRSAYHAKGWPIAVLQDLFRQAILHLSQHTKVSFYIDALDEGDNEEQVRGMVDFFYEVAERAVSNSLPFHICLASRYYPKVSVASYEELRLEDHGGHDADISEYVHNKLRIGNPQLKQRLSTEIRRRSSSVFLWVVLVVAILNRENDRGNQYLLLRRLQEIPEGLLQLFQDLRSRGSSDNRFLPAIEWVLHAISPLEPEDLYIAILTSTGELTAEGLACIHQTIDADTVSDFITSSSKGFLETASMSPRNEQHSGSGPKVHFIHETVREYFLVASEFDNQWLGTECAQMRQNSNSKHHGTEPVASTTRIADHAPMGTESSYGSRSVEDTTAISHARLSQTCQAYIRISYASDLQQKSHSRYEYLHIGDFDNRPFLWYSLEKVLMHAVAASINGWLVSNLAEKFPWDEWVYHKLAIQDYLSEQNVSPDDHAYHRMHTWLQRMAYEGHPELVKDELGSICAKSKQSQEGVEPAQSLLDACASGVGSALHIAASCSDYDPSGLTCLELLLKSGADVNKTCKDVGTPLHLAVVAESPRMDAVRLLLKHGAHPNVKDHRGNSPLHYAILAQDTDLIETLVGHGAHYKGQIGAHGNAMQTAWQLNDRKFTAWMADLCADVARHDSRSAELGRKSLIRRRRAAMRKRARHPDYSAVF